MSTPRPNPPRWLLALVTVLALVSLAQGARNALREHGDLRYRHLVARLMWAGENPYRLYLSHELSPRTNEILAGKWRDCRPDYLPSAMLPMMPLALVPLGMAKLLWLAVNLAAAALLVWTLRQWPPVASLAPPWFWLATGLWVAGTPFRNNLGLGQNCVFALALTLAAFHFQQRRRFILAGILLALGLFKYSYVGLLVLFFFVLHRGWKTLFVAGGIHLAAHLALCALMHAHPLGVLKEQMQVNAQVFQRNEMLTLWLPFRWLAAEFPHLPLPANVLGLLTLLAMLAGLVGLWRRYAAPDNYLAWVFILCLLATLVVTSRIYHFAFCLTGWLWLVTLPPAPALRVARWTLAGTLLYLTLLHRLVEAFTAWQKWEAAQALQWAFNAGFFLLCVASVYLFLRTVRGSGDLDTSKVTSGRI